MKNKNNIPAFPIEKWPVKFNKRGYAETFKSYSGMTLRDYFAAKVMQGLIIANKFIIDEDEEIPTIHGLMKKTTKPRRQSTDYSFFIADAMLKARDN